MSDSGPKRPCGNGKEGEEEEGEEEEMLFDTASLTGDVLEVSVVTWLRSRVHQHNNRISVPQASGEVKRCFEQTPVRTTCSSVHLRNTQQRQEAPPSVTVTQRQVKNTA